MGTDDRRGGEIAHGVEASKVSLGSGSTSGVDKSPPPDHSEYSISAAMRLDPNTHAYVMATAFLTSICFAIAAMSVIGLAIHLFVPGAS